MCHRQFLKVDSQNREFLQTHCNDLCYPFQFACRKWCLDYQSSEKLYVTLLI